MLNFSPQTLSTPGSADNASDFGKKQSFLPHAQDRWEEPVSHRHTGVNPPDRISPDSSSRAVSRQPSVY